MSKDLSPQLCQKLENLRYCFMEEAYEDAAGHLCDLLDYCRTRIEDNRGWIPKDLIAVVKYYGESPNQIKEE